MADLPEMVEHELTEQEARASGDYKSMVEILKTFKPGEYVFLKNRIPNFGELARRITPEEIIGNLKKEGLYIDRSEDSNAPFGYAVLVVKEVDRPTIGRWIMVYRRE